jgi:hypothetical protein
MDLQRILEEVAAIATLKWALLPKKRTNYLPYNKILSNVSIRRVLLSLVQKFFHDLTTGMVLMPYLVKLN